MDFSPQRGGGVSSGARVGTGRKRNSSVWCLLLWRGFDERCRYSALLGKRLEKGTGRKLSLVGKKENASNVDGAGARYEDSLWIRTCGFPPVGVIVYVFSVFSCHTTAGGKSTGRLFFFFQTVRAQIVDFFFLLFCFPADFRVFFSCVFLEVCCTELCAFFFLFYFGRYVNEFPLVASSHPRKKSAVVTHYVIGLKATKAANEWVMCLWFFAYIFPRG